jgi:hypothetical protein
MEREESAATVGPRGGSDAGANGAGPLHVGTEPGPQSRKAAWSLWLGLAGFAFGFLLMFAVFTPAGLVAAVGALRDMRVQPSLRGRWKAWTGIGLAIVSPILWVSAFLTYADTGNFGLF